MFGDRFSASTSCSRWLHETEPGRPNPSLSCCFLKVATHPRRFLHGNCWSRRGGHGQLQGLPVLPREPDHPGRGLARGPAEENELGRPAAGIHKMGEEQVGCGGRRVFIHRRRRRDQNVVAWVDRQPKADGGDVGRRGRNSENSRERGGQRGEEFVDESGHVARCGNGERRGGVRSRSPSRSVNSSETVVGAPERIGQGDAGCAPSGAGRACRWPRRTRGTRRRTVDAGTPASDTVMPSFWNAKILTPDGAGWPGSGACPYRSDLEGTRGDWQSGGASHCVGGIA